MDIGLHDIAEQACVFAGTILMNGKLTEDKVRKNTVGFSLENRTYVTSIAVGAISVYHEALRETLLKQGIDIGRFIDDPDADESAE